MSSVREETVKTAASGCGVPAGAIEDIHGVTPMQEGLWAASQRQKNAYNYELVMDVKKEAVGRLCAAWARLVKMTPMLRSCLVLTTEKDGRGWARGKRHRLLQVVLCDSYLESERTVGGTQSEAARRLAALGMAWFQIESGSSPTKSEQTRATRQSSTKMTLRLHHALFDGWAMRLVLQELRTCYLGEPITPPPPFRRFVEYLDRLDLGQGGEEARQFWHDKLSGSSPTEMVVCPAGHEPTTDATASFVSEKPLLTPGSRVNRELDSATTAATTVTTATVVHTAWAMLMGAYAATDDVLFAVITSGRDAPVPGVLDMAGPTMAAVPSRVVLDRDMPVEKLLEQVARDSQAVLPYQHSGISRICLDYAGITRVPQVLLLVQPSNVDVVGFSANSKQNQTEEADDAGKSAFDWRVTSHVDVVHPYALVVECWTLRGRPGSDSSQLRFTAHYDSRLFTEMQAGRLLEQLSHLVMTLTAHLEKRDPSSDAIMRVGDVAMASPRDMGFLQQLTRLSLLPLNAVSMISLDELSNKLAQKLVSRGVGAESKVLVFSPKSAWVVVGLLAILKAGGAFVPLEPAHPDSRLQDITRISGASVALAHPSLVPRLKELVRSKSVVDVLDMTDTCLTETECFAPNTGRTRSSQACPSDLAYIIFTSGTTGVPKGVEVQHRAVCSSITARMGPAAMDMAQGSRVLHFSPYCFDSMIDEIFMALSSGACICVGHEDELKDDLSGVIDRYAVTWAFLTPSVARTIDPKSVAAAVQLDGSLLYLGRIDGDSQTKLRGQRFELSEVESHSLSAQDFMQLGVREVAAFVFDRCGQDRGQLLSGVPTTTTPCTRALALAFVQNQHENKILNTTDPRIPTTDTRELNREQMPQTLDLSAGLRDRVRHVCQTLSAALPAYMVPTYWVPIDRMPLMPSTKTDRRRLAQLMQSFSAEEVAVFSAEHATLEHKAATTSAERKLARLFGSVLDTDPEKISICGDFLSLGGDSIRAMRLAASCRSDGLYGVTTASILRLRTIEALAKNLGGDNIDASLQGSVSDNGDESSPKHSMIPPAFSILRFLEIPESEAVGAAVDALGVAASCIQDIYPATPLQKALFTLGSIHNDAYKGVFVFDISAATKLDIVQRAWAALKAATPIIRTRLFRFRSNIWQAVVQNDGSTCAVITSDSLEKYLEEQGNILREMTFGSELFSANIVAVDSSQGPKQHHLVMNVHHALYDGRSIGIIIKEFERVCSDSACLNRSFCEKNAYSRFVNYIVQVDSASSRDFWREYLGDSHSTFVTFPDVKSRPPFQLDINQRRQGALTDSTVEISSSLPEKESHFTLSAVMYAAWSQLAAAYSSSDDVIFGVTSHGRDIPALPHSWDIVGPTIATYPLRVRIPSRSSDALAHDFVRGVEEGAAMITVKGFEHYGLDEIGRATAGGESGDTAASPCSFHSLVIVQAPQERETRKGVFQKVRDVGANAHPYPLVLEATPLLDTGELRITAHYDSSLLDQETVLRLLNQLAHVVQETARLAKPGTGAKLRDVGLLSPADASSIFLDWNASSTLSSRIDSCVHDLIASRVEEQPHEPAVCAWDLSLSYAELQNLAGSLAAVLTREGVEPGQFVAICVERSSWTAVCQLAVLKAGGASRNQDIISQSRAKFAVVSNATRALFCRSDLPVTTIVASEVLQSQSAAGMLPSPSTPPTEQLASTPVRPSDPAYCVFTSGSTGSPKGIVIDHAALCTSASSYGPALGLGPSSRVLHFASCTFDVSVGEVLTTLMHGGCVCIPDEEARLNDLSGCIDSFRANWLYLTSSVAGILSPKDPRVSSLKTLVVGGEAVQQKVVETWAESDVTLINAYGPAETTIYCSSRIVTSRDIDARDIGKAVGCRMWIVSPNDHHRLLPIGATGEIVVDGPILAIGYLNQPDLTAAHFTSSVPFLPEGHRVYRTGDLACYAADGNFHFRGRRDTQVKVNGQRVDFLEVEKQILKLKEPPCSVQHAAVVSFKRQILGHTSALTRGEMSQSEEFAAYICFDDPKAVSESTSLVLLGSNEQGLATTALLPLTAAISMRLSHVKSRLQDILPTYMWPTVYLPVASLPKTTSSKLDRKALKQTVESLSEAELLTLSAQALSSRSDPDGCLTLESKPPISSLTLPRDGLESELWRIWRKVLSRGGSIQTEDNFFALGGNSLSAMQLVWQARAQGLELSVSDLYSNPTISQLAEIVRVRARGKGGGGGGGGHNLPTPPLTGRFEYPPEPFSMVASEEKAAVELEAVRRLSISTDAIEDIYPATDNQIGLLLQTEQRAGLWVADDWWELPDGLDIDEFRAAWDAVVDRCPILRTRVLQVDSGPASQSKAYQIVLRSESEACQHQRPSNIYKNEESLHEMGFGTPLSVYRIITGSSRNMLQWTRHHAIYDGWSTQLILGLVADMYHGITPRDTRPFSYHVRNLQSLDKDAARAFWLSELAGVGADAYRACCFPCESTHGLSQSPTVSEPATQSQMRRDLKLRGLREETYPGSVVGVSVAMSTVLEAAWAFVISAYTGSQDTLFAVVQSGRTNDADPGILQVVGPTMSLVPRRVRLNDRQELGFFLRACQQRAQAAVQYEGIGIEIMRKVLSGSHASINNLLVIQAGVAEAVHHDNIAGDDGLAALGLLPVTTGLPSTDTAAFPFGLVFECVVPRLDGGSRNSHFELVAHYDNGFIKEDTVECLISHFQHVVNEMVQLPPETILGDLSIWEPDQTSPLLRRLRGNPPPEAVETCVHDLVARHWHIDSQLLDHPAVVMRTSGSDGPSHPTLTYRDLGKYSGVICSRLSRNTEMRSAFATGEVDRRHLFVAICLEKSVWTIPIMIGVWQAGAAVVLLDPELPRYRLRKAVQQVNAVLVLVSRATRHLWDEPDDGYAMDGPNIKSLLMTLPLEEEDDSHSQEETKLRESRPENACYCVFTSGSTAEPKGVIVQHRAISTSAVYHGLEAALDHTSRVLQFSSYSFDVAIDEMVTTLVHGGCVCVVGEEDRKSPADLVDAMREMEVNVALLTPAVLQTLDPYSVPACLKTLVVGGSPLNSSLLTQWENRVRLLVAYGPSECSITATMNSDVGNSPLSTIGRPVGCRAWVLGPVQTSDRDEATSKQDPNPRMLRLVPLGCVGELAIEGPILAEGYVGNPRLTAERFIFASNVAGDFCRVTGCRPETRLYRTGDLVRQNPDGSLLFLGRIDSQVKVRGVRVELEAIEHCILESTDVRGVVVAHPEKGPFSGRLVAVVQLQDRDIRDESLLTPASVTAESNVQITLAPDSVLKGARGHVKDRLPPSHVPTVWATVGQLPLLRSGKVDRTVIRRQLENHDAFTVHHDSPRQNGFSSVSRTPSPRVDGRGKSTGTPTYTSPIETKVRDLMSQVLGIDLSSVPSTSSFARLGGDSLLAMQLVARARTAGVPGISVAKLLGDTSIAELVQGASVAAAELGSRNSQTKRRPVRRPRLRPLESPEPPEATYDQYTIALTSPQRMFFVHYPFGPGYFNQSVSVSIRSPRPTLTPSDIRGHLLSLVERHHALRSRFWRRRAHTPEGDGLVWHWESIVTEDTAGSLRFRAHVIDGETVDIARVALETHQSLNISSGPLFAADLFRLPHGDMELLLVAHHLVVDIVSWSILLGDLEALLLGAELGPDPASPPDSGNPFSKTGDITQRECIPGTSDNREEALKFWDVDMRGASAGFESLAGSRSVRFSMSLGKTDSRLLSEAVSSIDQLEIGDVVEAVVAKVFATFCRDKGRMSSPLVYAEDHGRDFDDDGRGNTSVTRVGWLTRVRPVDFPLLSPQTSLVEAIWHARSGRQQPSSEAPGSTAWIPPLPLELVINYTGRPLVGSGSSSTLTPSSGPLKPVSTTTAAALATVPDTDPCLMPLALIEVLAALSDGEELELKVTYDARIQSVGMVRCFLESCIRVLHDEVIPNLAVDSVSGWRSNLRFLPGLGDETTEYTTSQRRRKLVMERLGLDVTDDIETVRACSTAQTQILLAQAQAQARVPHSSVYQVQAVWEVSTLRLHDHECRPTEDAQRRATHGVDLARLQNACETVVRHHPALRTAFVQLPDMANPVQVVLRDGCADTVLRVTPKALRPSEPRPAATTAHLELRINHASFDGSSSALLLRDIATAYSGELLDPSSASAAHGYFKNLVKAREEVQMADAFWAQHLEDVEPCRLPPLGSGPGPGPGSGSGTSNLGDADSAVGSFDESLSFRGEKFSLSNWCRRFGATTAVAIHAAWAMALNAYCYTSSTEAHDVCFGWISSGRDAPVEGLEKAIGMFANLLVCRVQLGPVTLLRDAVAATARNMAEELQHQIGRPQLHRHGEPLCDTLVTVQSASSSTDPPGHGQLSFRQIQGLDHVEYSLVLNLGLAGDNDDTIDCRVTYDDTRISETAARAFFAVFRQALTAIITTAADSAATVSDIDLFPSFHHELAHDFNNTHTSGNNTERLIPIDHPLEQSYTPAPSASTVVSLFSDQVRARPDAVAVDAWDASLTFSQLDGLSMSLCQHLVHRLGLSRGDHVALLCDKSAWVVVAMLAVLRAGAACAFLSPADGLNRLRNMVTEQMRANVIIASPAHEDKARALLGDCHRNDRNSSRVVVLDPDSDVFIRDPCINAAKGLLDRSQPDSVAFVLFTSGSTGTPKGIRLTHSSLCLSILNYTRRLGISHQSRLFQFSAYTFDVGIGDMLASLATGAVLCVPCEQDRLGNLNGAIDGYRATHVILTPSVAAFLRPERLGNGGLRTMVLIGEVATSELYKTWHGRVRLFNAYGPAECSVLTTVYEVGSPDDNPAVIGGAVAPHCRVWLVDAADPSRLVPVGSSGELLIEGQHVALGYLNDPEKTARAFISAEEAPAAIRPLLPRAGLYLTGDLARLVPHHGLVFLGRKDLQIKLRGQRVEMGEIEFHVRRRAHECRCHLQHSGGDREDGVSIMAAVVVAKQASGEDSLVAFVSLTPGSELMLEDEGRDRDEDDEDSRLSDEFFVHLRSRLSLDLPPYMVPSRFLPISRLPQTPSGKLDRKKLLQLATEHCSPQAAKCLDATQTNTCRIDDELHHPSALDNTFSPSQQRLRSLWAKVLKVEAASIGPNDNFFSLGGDSILAMRLAAAGLEEGVRLSVLTIMRYPIFSRMAAEVDQNQGVDANHDAVERRDGHTEASPGDATAVDDISASLQPLDDQREFSATSFQEAILAFNMAPARGFLNYFILKLDSRVDTIHLEAACRSMLTRHPVLRSSFSYREQRLFQRIRPLEAVNIQTLNIPHAVRSEPSSTIDTHTAGLIDSDRNAPLTWGDCLTKAFIIRHQDTGASRLVLRLSHALYDGMCLSTLWDDLSSAYNSGFQPESATNEQAYGFVHFASAVAAEVPQSSQAFWHGLLRGSDITPVVRNTHQRETGALMQPTPTLGLMQGRQSSTVPSCSLVMPSFTPASVLKAAWAVVLAANSPGVRDEVVFGHVVSCRETLAPSMQDVVGAFVNCVPVRVDLAAGGAPRTIDTASAVRRLVEQVQEQHVAGLPHHAVGLGQLVRAGCVEWKRARFYSVVQYQNLPVSKTRGLTVVESGPLRGTAIEIDGRAGAYADVWVTAVPLDTERTEVEICYDLSVVEDQLAQVLLEGLCTALRSMCV
ncbi:non-ribosomal peptide synthetase [Colletotrichum tabaci]|uniref:Non-ribosomal peptide synthetase n=1 Tax=Colletotrichum tabaci TaxID=1209068 RepID=A0AAV9TIN3_9PEZI